MKHKFTALICATMAFASFQANATLGQPVTSVKSDAAVFHADSKPDEIKASGNATCHRIVYGRASICEYSENGGPVYAITWHGHGHPDLAQIMGQANYDEYQKARSQKPFARGRMSYWKTENLIVKLIGIQRNMQGLVCMPKLLPANVASCGDLP